MSAEVTESPKLREHCARLGVCQAFHPRCQVCDEHDINPEDPDANDPWAEISYWGSVFIVGAITTVFVGVALGFVITRWGT